MLPPLLELPNTQAWMIRYTNADGKSTYTTRQGKRPYSAEDALKATTQFVRDNLIECIECAPMI